MAAGNNLLHAHDIKEGMEHVGGIRNVKVAVEEIIPGAGMRLVNTKYFLSCFLYISRLYRQN